MTRVAIMQPYFFPYAGYFRLCAETDLFIVLDDVQFPRRGWVHRNKLIDSVRRPSWLTLPLRPSRRDSTITDQRFADDARAMLAERVRRFPDLCRHGEASSPLLESLFACHRPFVDYLTAQLRLVCTMLGITTPMARASDFGVDPAIRGADRIIALARAAGASTYVNAPGGRALYERGTFARHGLTLEFLADYAGDPISILQRLQTEPVRAVRDSIR